MKSENIYVLPFNRLVRGLAYVLTVGSLLCTLVRCDGSKQVLDPFTDSDCPPGAKTSGNPVLIQKLSSIKSKDFYGTCKVKPDTNKRAKYNVC